MLNQATLFPQKVATRKDLRDYQDAAVVAIFDYFAEKDGHPIVVVPTGGGKSLICAEFIYRANQYYPGTRFVVLSHVAILLEQNAEELINQWPEANFTYYSDSLGQKDMSGDIVFAGIQSIYKKAYDFRRAPDIIIIDECHTTPADGNTMYRKFIDDMLIINPSIKVVGLTATPYRSGDGYLHKGENALFTDIAYEIPIGELIARGHLSPIITPDGGVRTKMDATGVGMRGGDYIQSQLARAVDKDAITKACVDEIIQFGADRNKWMVFTVDIKHCEHVRQEIESRGISCGAVHSKMSTLESNAIIDRFRNGDLRCLVNVAKLTTGFNVPSIDLIAYMRPMRSPVLYTQTAGRGMRIFPRKTDCLLLDFGGVVEELGPIDQIRIKEKLDGEGEAPTKQCPECGEFCFAGCIECPTCGYEFPERDINLETRASSAAVLSSQMKPVEMKVSRVAYYRHRKEGKPDTMRVEYLCGFETFREWICFSHGGRPREDACNWWRKRSTATLLPPKGTDEALQRAAAKELKVPESIKVRKVGKYYEVVDYEFNDAP